MPTLWSRGLLNRYVIARLTVLPDTGIMQQGTLDNEYPSGISENPGLGSRGGKRSHSIDDAGFCQTIHSSLDSVLTARKARALSDSDELDGELGARWSRIPVLKRSPGTSLGS